MGDIFQEVDEEVRRDRFTKFWKNYGAYIIGSAVAVVIGTGASVGWHEVKSQRQLDVSDRFMAAIALAAEENKRREAADAFMTISDEGQDGYSLFARFRAADALMEADDRVAAVQTFWSISEDNSVSDLYRSLATLLAIMNTIDIGDPEHLRDRLTPLLTPDGIWRHSARELSGALALRIGDRELAKTEFQKLADDLVAPPGMRARAAEMLQIIEN